MAAFAAWPTLAQAASSPGSHRSHTPTVARGRILGVSETRFVCMSPPGRSPELLGLQPLEISLVSERAVPRSRGIDAKVCRGNPWRPEQHGYILRQLFGLVPADVGVVAEVQVGLT